MKKNIEILIEENKNDFFRFFHKVAGHENKLLVKGQLLELLNDFAKNGDKGNHKAINEAVRSITESVCLGNDIFIESREKIGESHFFLFNLEDRFFENISVLQYLKAKEDLVEPGSASNIPTLNFKTFYDKFPSVRDPKNIGKGVEYLNRYLSSRMFTEPEKLQKALFDFLFVHKCKNQQLILNERIKNTEQLSKNIDRALNFLRKKDEDEPFSKFKHDLQNLGFEQGLGNDAESVIVIIQGFFFYKPMPVNEIEMLAY